MRNKLSVQQGEEGDEEDDGMDVSAKGKQWGKSKRGYYGADTEDYEVPVIHTRHNTVFPLAYFLAFQHSSMGLQANLHGKPGHA